MNLKPGEVRKTLHGWRYGTLSGVDLITVYCNPPIPIRLFDWCCYRDGDEEMSQWYGWGKTEQEALADWRRMQREAHEVEHPEDDEMRQWRLEHGV